MTTSTDRHPHNDVYSPWWAILSHRERRYIRLMYRYLRGHLDVEDARRTVLSIVLELRPER